MKFKKQFIIALACIVVMSGVFLGVSYLGENHQVFKNSANNTVEDKEKDTKEKTEKEENKTSNTTNNVTTEEKGTVIDKENKKAEDEKNETKDKENEKVSKEEIKDGYYVVKSNDTLYSIARTYMPSYDASEVVAGILKKNNMKQEDPIIDGQKLVISYEVSLNNKQKTDEEAEKKMDDTSQDSAHEKHMKYTIKSGDTLYSIAGKFLPKMDIAEAIKTIKTHNDIKEDIIKVDSTLCIPVEE